jgi:hypothetical protein
MAPTLADRRGAGFPLLTPRPDRWTGPLHRPPRAAGSPRPGPDGGKTAGPLSWPTVHRPSMPERVTPRESVSPGVVPRTGLLWNQPGLRADGQTPGEAQGKRLTIDLQKSAYDHVHGGYGKDHHASALVAGVCARRPDTCPGRRRRGHQPGHGCRMPSVRTAVVPEAANGQSVDPFRLATTSSTLPQGRPCGRPPPAAVLGRRTSDQPELAPRGVRAR